MKITIKKNGIYTGNGKLPDYPIAEIERFSITMDGIFAYMTIHTEGKRIDLDSIQMDYKLVSAMSGEEIKDADIDGFSVGWTNKSDFPHWEPYGNVYLKPGMGYDETDKTELTVFHFVDKPSKPSTYDRVMEIVKDKPK